MQSTGEEDSDDGKSADSAEIHEIMARLSVKGHAPVETASQIYLAVKDIRDTRARNWKLLASMLPAGSSESPGP